MIQSSADIPDRVLVLKHRTETTRLILTSIRYVTY